MCIKLDLSSIRVIINSAVSIHINLLVMIVLTIGHILNQGRQMQLHPASHSSDSHVRSHTQQSNDQG